MELTHEMIDGMMVVRCVEPRLDALVAIKFKDGFHDLVGSDSTRFILDLSNVLFLDSSGLGAVVAVYKLLGSDRTLDLVGLTSAVERVFKLTRMDSVFAIYPDVASAVAAGRAAGPGIAATG